MTTGRINQVTRRIGRARKRPGRRTEVRAPPGPFAIRGPRYSRRGAESRRPSTNKLPSLAARAEVPVQESLANRQRRLHPRQAVWGTDEALEARSRARLLSTQDAPREGPHTASGFPEQIRLLRAPLDRKWLDTDFRPAKRPFVQFTYFTTYTYKRLGRDYPSRTTLPLLYRRVFP